MKRNYVEQAKSAVKFTRLVGGLRPVPDADKRLCKSYRATETGSIEAWRNLGPVKQFTFENLIERPEAIARAVCEWIGSELDVDAMVKQVRKRTTQCLHGLLELELIEESANV